MPENESTTGRVIAVSFLLALGIAAYLFFTWLSGRQVGPGMEASYRSLAVSAVLTAGSLATGRLAVLFLSRYWEERLEPGILASSYVLAGVGLWLGLSAFSEQAQVMSGVGLACLTATVGLAVTHLAAYAERADFGGVFSGIFGWLVDARSLVVVIAACIGTYAFIIRPLFSRGWAYSVLVEWTVVSLAGIVILGVTYFLIGRSFVEEESPAPNWRRHEQQVTAMTDPEYTQLSRLERRFVDDSDKALLLYYLVSLLDKNGVREKEMAAALVPLLEYSEPRRHGRIERARRLKTATDAMQAAVQPSRYAVQAAHDASATVVDEQDKTTQELAADFCRGGDCGRLVVRLSRLLSGSGTREDDSELVLRPLATYDGNSQGMRQRERLWRDIIAAAGLYAPRIKLKE